MFVSPPAEAVGQTSGEWIFLGDYILPKGDKASVTLTAKNANGVVIADALLFEPLSK